MKKTGQDFCIISGGQTGADRAALDAAIKHKITHGGYCPKGRLAENGKIADKYKLTETKSADYEQRTKKNVRESDATVIFSIAPELSGGTLNTQKYALKKNKPLLVLNKDSPDPVTQLNNFISKYKIRLFRK